jgi:acetyl-CoA acyltransferase
MYRDVIAGYYRSQFTLAKKGALINIKPDELLSEVIKDLISKTKA